MNNIKYNKKCNIRNIVNYIDMMGLPWLGVCVCCVLVRSKLKLGVST